MHIRAYASSWPICVVSLFFGAVDVSAIERSPSQVILFCFQLCQSLAYLALAAAPLGKWQINVLLFECVNKFHITTQSLHTLDQGQET